MTPTYRQRRAEGLIVRHRPLRIADPVRAEIRRQYLRREFRQIELALLHHVSQSTIARIVAE